MMFRCRCTAWLVLIWVSSGLLRAQPIEFPDRFTANGQTFTGAKYSSHDASRITIMHDTGVASLPLTSLPQELKEKLGFDEKAAAEAENQRSKKQAELAKAQQQQQAQAADLNSDQVWTFNNADVFASGGSPTLAISVLELKKGGACQMSLVTAEGRIVSAGTWKLQTRPEGGLTYDLALEDGSECSFLTKVGGAEGVLTRGGGVVAVFKRKTTE